MTGAKFERLVEIMATLRGPNGCPWDKEQTFETLEPMMIEEVYEVIDSIDKRDFPGLAEELGDLLLHIVFQARLAGEAGHFDIDAVVDGICSKLIRRHPHVFGSLQVDSPDEVVKNWEAIKAQEKADKATRAEAPPAALLDAVPTRLPALHEAHQISARVAKVGFDWPDIRNVFDKLQEEVRELETEIPEGSSDRLADEVGDLLFVVVNLARHLKVDSESALKRSNRKFRSRFAYLEAQILRSGRGLADASLDEMELLWQEAKAQS